jgi:hypothetical protein
MFELNAGGRGFLGDPVLSGAACGMTIAGIVGPAATCPGAGRALEAAGLGEEVIDAVGQVQEVVALVDDERGVGT